MGRAAYPGLVSDVSDCQIVFSGSQASTAVDRSISFRLERYSSLASAVCTGDFSCGIHIFSAALNSYQDATVRTTFRFICQTFCLEEVLLATRKDKGGVAMATVQNFIDIGHNVIPEETRATLLLINSAFGDCYIFIVIGYTFSETAQLGRLVRSTSEIPEFPESLVYQRFWGA